MIKKVGDGDDEKNEANSRNSKNGEKSESEKLKNSLGNDVEKD